MRGTRISTRDAIIAGAILAACGAQISCGNGSTSGDLDSGLDAGLDGGDGDSDSDTDADTDADSDSDSDADSDADADADTDADADASIDGGLGCTDLDDDGWCAPFDCDDGNPEIHPGVIEIMDGGVDDDCDSLTDEEDDTGEEELCPSEIAVMWRDFADTEADFGCHMHCGVITPGLVLDTLDADRKPQYNPSAVVEDTDCSDPQITSAATFYQWFHDVPGVNVTTEGVLPLTEDTDGSGLFSYTDTDYVVVAGQGSFTSEIHSEFVYESGQVFSFLGDDDVWVFIDNQLVVDVGGLHGQQPGSVDLDTLGLTPGETYNIDMFHAERCYPVSVFRLQTSIECFTPVVVK